MSDLRQAAQQALEALEVLDAPPSGAIDHYELERRKQALRDVLAQEDQEPVAWTDRELELLDGMIEVQLRHAAQCDAIANRPMAERQKGWDMERVALLRKIKNSPPRRETEREPTMRIKCTVVDNQHPSGVPFEQWVNAPRREWQSLTDEDIALIDWEKLRTRKDAVRAVDARLRELNHG